MTCLRLFESSHPPKRAISAFSSEDRLAKELQCAFMGISSKRLPIRLATHGGYLSPVFTIIPGMKPTVEKNLLAHRLLKIVLLVIALLLLALGLNYRQIIAYRTIWTEPARSNRQAQNLPANFQNPSSKQDRFDGHRPPGVSKFDAASMTTPALASPDAQIWSGNVPVVIQSR